MAKLTLNTIGSRYGSIDALNDNFDAIEQAIENTFSLDGTSPNALEVDLDMNSNAILNASEVDTTTLRINGVLVEPSTTLISGAAFQTYSYTATAGQTTFSVAPATPFNSSIVVIVNGLQLSPNEVNVSGTNVTTPALTLGDEVVIRRYTAEPVPAPTASEVNYTPAGTNAVTTTVQNKLRESVSVKDFGAVGNGIADDTAAIQAALNAHNSVYIPSGTYLISSVIQPRATQLIYGDGVNRSVLKATTVGMICLSYPSGAYSNVVLRDFSIDGDNKALTGLSMIASGQGAISNCEISNLQIAQCTLYQAYLSQITYCVVDRCAFIYGQYGLYLNDCFSSEVKNCIAHGGSQSSLILAKGSQITVSKSNFFNNSAYPSTALVIVDSAYGNAFVDCEFEPQGAANVTYEVILRSGLGTSCTDNAFTRCRFIGQSTTKTNCIALGTLGFAFKTRIIECGFIKPSGSSVLLLGQAETSISGSYDLVTYTTPTYSPVTVTNSSGNPYFVESLTGVFDNVTTKAGVTFPAVQVPSANANTLDDYEEGTWTPTLTGGTTDPTGVSFSNGTTGTYVKVGRLVMARFYFGTITWGAAGTGTFFVSGLPFSGGDSFTPVSIGIGSVLPSAATGILNGDGRVYFAANGTATAQTWASAVASGQLSIRATYYANA